MQQHKAWSPSHLKQEFTKYFLIKKKKQSQQLEYIFKKNKTKKTRHNYFWANVSKPTFLIPIPLIGTSRTKWLKNARNQEDFEQVNKDGQIFAGRHDGRWDWWCLMLSDPVYWPFSKRGRGLYRYPAWLQKTGTEPRVCTKDSVWLCTWINCSVST